MLKLGGPGCPGRYAPPPSALNTMEHKTLNKEHEK
jgi:hypothetical protein